VHGCRQYQPIARQGRWGSSFLSGHKTTASYWPLPALQNVSKRLSPSTACTEVGSFLGEVPYERGSVFVDPELHWQRAATMCSCTLWAWCH